MSSLRGAVSSCRAPPWLHGSGLSHAAPLLSGSAPAMRLTSPAVRPPWPGVHDGGRCASASRVRAAAAAAPSPLPSCSSVLEPAPGQQEPGAGGAIHAAPAALRPLLAVAAWSAWRLPAAVACIGLAAVAVAAYPGQSIAASAAAATDPLSGLLSFVLHLDKHLSAMIAEHGHAAYAVLFGIVFCETGLVLTPFLPGDSLLFAAGALAGMGKLNVATLMAVFIISAILGDAVNYAVGSGLGRWAIAKGLVKTEYVEKTEKFYEKYGGKTVVLARFVPIIRTFAPFVAGIGSMAYSKFALYNVAGAILWTVLFVGGGFFFGNLPFVQKNFSAVVLAIVVVSVLPIFAELLAARREHQQEAKKAQTQSPPTEAGGEDGGGPGQAPAAS